MLSTPYTATELVKLCKTESFCIFHHHNGSIWHIHSNLHNRGRYQYLDLIGSKGLHDPVLFFWLHFAVKDLYSDLVRQDFLKLSGIICDILCIQSFALFHHWADHISLSSHLHLLFNKRIRLGAVGSSYYAIFDRKPFCRKLIDDRNIQISV